MNLTVNGQPHHHRGDGRISALLSELGAPAEHTAITLNGEIAPSATWNSVQLHENDTVEVLTFVGGG